MMRKRLLLDVDEVLLDFQTPMFNIAEMLFGKRLTPDDCEVWDCFTLFTPEERGAIFEHIEKPGWCRALKPKEGAQEAVVELRKLVDVYAVTSHFPSSPTWVHERDASLIEHFAFARGNIVHTSAKRIVSGDYLLDDNPGHVTNWADEHPDGTGMLWHIPNTRKLGFDDIRMNSWADVIARVASTIDRESVYDLLEEREWQRESYPNEGNYCQTCGASAKGSRIPQHLLECRLNNILAWHRKRSG